MRKPLTETRPDEGLTLVELLVTMVIMGVISVLLTTMFITVTRAVTFNDDEQRGLAETRKVVERLGRDVRQADGVAPGADDTRLVLWIDGKTVTWRFVEPPGGTPHLTRNDGTGDRLQATALVKEKKTPPFSYGTATQPDGTLDSLTVPLSTPDASRVRLVTTTLTYDALSNRGSQKRTVEFSSRLRNVS